MDIATNIINKNIRNIKDGKTKLIPCNTTVIIEFYDENPYRKIETTETGLILGINSTHKYKSNESGEMTDNEEYIACAKVIAVGPGCKNVQEGEDILAVKHLATPVPYLNKGYMALSESNIICRIVNDND